MLNSLRYSAWLAGRRDLSRIERFGAALHARAVGDEETAWKLLASLDDDEPPTPERGGLDEGEGQVA